ncbi:hypothetical protein B0O80DRAFT_498208 [Mortierella sp. GBAus27b]|nr:hypothetical protein BGX31_004421 [Mortierella sp. GBA43]KAI8355029.1 hypothetical protein B0O80DRAFT_498208 [Mortierella sp. GBAus27b]
MFDDVRNFWNRRGLAWRRPLTRYDSALRTGILGVSNITPGALISPVKGICSIHLVAVAGPDETKAKAFGEKHGIPHFRSCEDLLNDPSIICIYMALPNGRTFDWTMNALNAGKHVLLEKPASWTADQTRELFEIADRNNLVLLNGFHYRYHPVCVDFRETLERHIREGHPLTHVKVALSISPLYIIGTSDIWISFKQANRAMMDVGCYAINAIRYFTGLEISSVERATAKPVSENANANADRRMEGILNLTGDHSPGVKAHFTTSLTTSLGSWQTYREVFPLFTAETDQKVFTFGVFVSPDVYHYIDVKDKGTGKVEHLPKGYGAGYTSYHYQLVSFIRAVKHQRDGSRGDNGPGWVDRQDTILNQIAVDSIYTAANMRRAE